MGHAYCQLRSLRDVLPTRLRRPCHQRGRLRDDPQAFFDPDYLLPRPVEAAADGSALEPWRGAGLTLGNEIDKLAGNIALGRDAAGVHYRSDSVRGLFVGEQQALGLLRDYSRTYNERFDGFILRKLSGDRIRIIDGEVRPL
jgi:hypothetical protein